jgi:hypothetical protein
VRQKIRTRQFDRPVQMTGRIAPIVKVAPQFTLRSRGPSAQKKSDRKTQWGREQMLEPRGKDVDVTAGEISSRIRCVHLQSASRFPINRLQPPINRTGRMMMTSSAAQSTLLPFPIYLQDILPVRNGGKKDVAITNHKKMEDARRWRPV